MTEDQFTCRICGNNKENKNFIVREMLFGTKEEFDYSECSSCGCLQIKDIPENLEQYYPQNYNSREITTKTKDNTVKRFLKVTKSKHYLTENKNILGKYMLNKVGPLFLEKIKKTEVNLNSKILDVGSGSGGRLNSLIRDGFNNITGIDPFIEKDIHYNNGLSIYKKSIFEFDGQYDMVMLNHVFEHVPDSKSVLKEIYRLLKPGHIALIRVPVADSSSWKKYGVNWVALDAPRHLHIQTPKSMKILAAQTGFELFDVLFDSDEYQFWGSEQYAKDISMRGKRSYYENPNNSIFTKAQIEQYKLDAKELNKKGEGDAACFYLRKPG